MNSSKWHCKDTRVGKVLCGAKPTEYSWAGIVIPRIVEQEFFVSTYSVDCKRCRQIFNRGYRTMPFVLGMVDERKSP